MGLWVNRALLIFGRHSFHVRLNFVMLLKDLELLPKRVLNDVIGIDLDEILAVKNQLGLGLT